MMYFNLDSLKELGIKELKRQKFFLMIFGIISMMAGIFCFINPIGSSVILSILIGITFIISGLMYIILRLIYSKLHSFWSILIGLLLGILYLFLGFQFIKNPEVGIIAMAYLIGIGFLVVGIFRLIVGFSSKGSSEKFLLIFTAIIEILLSIFLIASWPANSIFLLSIFLGIEFICNSFDAFIASSYLKKLINDSK